MNASIMRRGRPMTPQELLWLGKKLLAHGPFVHRDVPSKEGCWAPDAEDALGADVAWFCNNVGWAGSCMGL